MPRPRKFKSNLPPTVTTVTQQVSDTLNGFAGTLKDSEEAVVESLKNLLADDNDTARVTAAIKIIENEQDKNMPGHIRDRLTAIKRQALDALLDVSRNGSVATAKANANAFLVKLMKANAPAIWPPDVTSDAWIQRMKRAMECCGEDLPPAA